MLRGDIKYALYRCKSGNPDQSHKNIAAPYRLLVDKLKMEFHDFGEEGGWDISTTAPFDGIITGGRLMMLHELRDESVINEDGTPKDELVAKAALDLAKRQKKITK